MSSIRPLRGLPFAAALLLAGCTGVPDGIEPVSPFDVDRYLGTWYEIARLDHSFERGLSNVTATYELRDDGRLRVLNRGFDVEECEWSEAEGTASFRGDTEVASLAVTFFWPFAGGYHLFALDSDEYAWAMISGSSRSYLWILARSPEPPEDLVQNLIERAAALDFPVDELIRVSHAEPACEPPETP